MIEQYITNSEEIRIGIVEDEVLWSKLIASALDEHGYIVAWIADTFEEAIKHLNENNCDLVLLDINLKNNTSGIELGKTIFNHYKKPFIFVTANLDPFTIKDAVNVKPSAYLTKPFQPATLVGTLQIAINNFNEQKASTSKADQVIDDSFFVRQGMKLKKIFWSQIVYLHSENNYVVIFNAKDETGYLIRSTLQKTLNDIIPDFLRSSFIQINRGEAINFNFIQETTMDEVKAGNKMFIVTKTFRDNLRNAIKVHE